MPTGIPRSPPTAGSVRSVGLSAAAPASSSVRRHQALQPMSENSLLGNSIYSRGNTHTPSSASTLDTMSSEISSKRKALAARRSNLPVSRTLKLSPAADTPIRQHDQDSVRVGGRPAATAAGSSSMLYSDVAGDHTHRSITQSALFSALDHSPSAPHRSMSPPTLHHQNDRTVPTSISPNNRHGFARHSSPSSQLSAITSCQDQHLGEPSTPAAAALGETDFLGGGDISDIDGGDRSRTWSDCSFTNAVFSPDPATPAVAHGGGSSNGRRVVTTRGEEEQATNTRSNVSPEEDHNSLTAAEIAMRNNSNGSKANNGGDTTTSACTPAAVSALLRMGGHPAAVAPTPYDGTAGSRYRGYAACSPVPLSAAVQYECDDGKGGAEVPSTPGAAATLASMMTGVNGNVGGSGAHAVEEEEEEEEGESFGEGEPMAGKQEQSLSHDTPAMDMPVCWQCVAIMYVALMAFAGPHCPYGVFESCAQSQHEYPDNTLR